MALVLLAFYSFFSFVHIQWKLVLSKKLYKIFALRVALEFIPSLNLNIFRLPTLSTSTIFEESIRYSNSKDIDIRLKCYIFAILKLWGFLSQTLFVYVCILVCSNVKGSKFHIYIVMKNSLWPPHWFFCWQTSVSSLTCSLWPQSGSLPFLQNRDC